MFRLGSFWLAIACLLLTGTYGVAVSSTIDARPQSATPDLSCEACKMILLDPGTTEKTEVDAKIAQTQARIKSTRNSGPQIERLGWLFVQKARVSNDPGFYKLAEQCALCLESANSNSLDALLLRGHVLHSLHHFKEAEPLALELTTKRGLAFDFGLFGDIEFDEGKIPEAVGAYQKMVDLRPDLESYSRVAQVRWITGDVPGAVEAMTMAAESGSPLNGEPTAWTYARLALYQLQLGDLADAKRSAVFGLRMQSNSAPALLTLGRIELADGDTNSAVKSFQAAAKLNHLPESQWLLADALRSRGKAHEADDVEKELERRGALEDPRSFSLYLSTRGRRTELALDLAKRELHTRGDIFTHDAMAWALEANGRATEAHAEMLKALAEGTQDARLFFHSAIICDACGDKGESLRYARLAWTSRQMLFPSELAELSRVAHREDLSKK
jgi:tetratricopeptide (TPR) repeat protein